MGNAQTLPSGCGSKKQKLGIRVCSHGNWVRVALKYESELPEPASRNQTRDFTTKITTNGRRVSAEAASETAQWPHPAARGGTAPLLGQGSGVRSQVQPEDNRGIGANLATKCLYEVTWKQIVSTFIKHSLQEINITKIFPPKLAYFFNQCIIVNQLAVFKQQYFFEDR